jgi:hypothetical protein
VDETDDWRLLLDQAAALGALPSHLVHAWGATPTALDADVAAGEAAVARARAAYRDLASFYGDLQGFIGNSLPTIEGLAIPKIECDERALIGN